LKRSNRLILLIGVLLAAVAFVGVIMISSPGGSNQATPTPPPTTAKVVQAKVDIAAGTKLTAAMVQLTEVQISAQTLDSIPDTGLAIGHRVFRAVSAGEQIGYSYFTESGAAVSVTDSIPKGLRAMAIQVDQVNGVGTLIHTGDNVDLIVSMKIQLTQADTVTKGQVTNIGQPASSVKMIMQNIQVIGTLLPPPVASNAAPAATPAPGSSAAPAAQAGTNLTGQNEIVIVAVTANQAEVIRFAQLDAEAGVAQDRGTTAVAVVLRSPKDYIQVDASGQPVLDSNGIPLPIVPPLEKTDGVILKTLIEKYGVLPPEILIK
jgi:Flp pilus assembly protein CpaB